ILGPSDVRDGIGRLGDAWLSPLSYVNDNYIRYGIYGVYVLDTRYRLLPQDKLLDEAYDPYTLLKNAYLNRRQFQVNDGNQSDEDIGKKERQQLEEEKRILEESGRDEPQRQDQPQGKDQPPR